MAHFRLKCCACNGNGDISPCHLRLFNHRKHGFAFAAKHRLAVIAFVRRTDCHSQLVARIVRIQNRSSAVRTTGYGNFVFRSTAILLYPKSCGKYRYHLASLLNCFDRKSTKESGRVVGRKQSVAPFLSDTHPYLPAKSPAVCKANCAGVQTVFARRFLYGRPFSPTGGWLTFD